MKLNELANLYIATWQSNQTQHMASAVKRYVLQTGVFPSSVSQIQSRYPEMRSQSGKWQSFVLSGTLDDGIQKFQRGVLVDLSPQYGIQYSNLTTATSNWISENTCGTGSALTAASWCSPKHDGISFRYESREAFSSQIIEQRARLKLTSEKIVSFFNDSGAFPSQTDAGSSIADDSNTPLKVAVGFTGSSANCSGVWSWQGIPLTCEDLFDVWGNPVGYYKVSSASVYLISETPITASSGEKTIIPLSLDVSSIN